MPQALRQQLIIVAVAVVVLFTNLGGPRLWDRDEPRNSGCAAEMLARHDWVVPIFNGELRTHKPVLLYWLMMSAYEVFGVSEFAARFWSATLGIGTLLMTYHLGRKLFSAGAGFWGALALCPALMFGVASRAATPDAVLIFCSTLAIFLYGMFAFDRGTHDGLERPSSGQYALIYAAMGLAILAKGPVGLVLPTAVIGMFLLIMRLPAQTAPPAGIVGHVLNLLRPFAPLHFIRTCASMKPQMALVALIVALPWYALVHWRTEGAWTAGFFFEHNLSRATQAMEGHRGNVLFYPAALAIGFFPWSVFFAPMLIDTVRQLRRRCEQSPGYVFAACWVGVYVVLFSIARTKLPSYITPCYPAVALLMGAFIQRVVTNEARDIRIWLRVGLGVAVVVGIGICVGVPIAASYILPGEQWLGVIGLAPLVAGALGWMFVKFEEERRAMIAYAVGAVAFTTLGFGLVTQRVDSHQQSDKLLAAIYAQHPEPRIGYYQALEPSWVFYTNQPLDNVTTSDDPNPLAPDLVPVPGTQRWERRQRTPVADFFATSDHYLITTRSALATLQPELPAGVEVLAEVPYFLRGQQQLIAIGRKSAGPPAHASLPTRLERYR